MKKENPSMSFVLKLLRLQNWRNPKPADAAPHQKFEYLRIKKHGILMKCTDTYTHSLRIYSRTLP